jgi:hypothetical protein
MEVLRREDAANQRAALHSLSQGDYRNARGWARLLIDDAQRRRLQLQMADQMPAEARAELMRELAEEDKAKAEDAKRQKWNATHRPSTPRRGKGKSEVAVQVIEPSPALAPDLGRLLARKMKYEKAS